MAADTEEVLIKAPTTKMGEISKIVQDHQADFLSIEQEGDNLVVIVRISSSRLQGLKDNLKEIFSDRFSVSLLKRN